MGKHDFSTWGSILALRFFIHSFIPPFAQEALLRVSGIRGSLVALGQSHEEPACIPKWGTTVGHFVTAVDQELLPGLHTEPA